MVELDTGKKGLLALQKDWQVELFTEILRDKKKTWTSREGLVFINKKTAYSKVGGTISRASVINYLDALAKEKILVKDEETGKGGHHGVYYAAMDWNQYGEYVVDVVLAKLLELFAENVKLRKIKS